MAAIEIDFRPLARTDVVEAAVHYARQNDDRLVGRFLAALDQAIASISAFPLGYPIYYRDSRKIMLRKFPYCLCYRVTGHTLQVLAVLHAKRDAGLQRQRAE